MKARINNDVNYIENSIARLDDLKKRLESDIRFDKYKIFISVGYKSSRASVFSGFEESIELAYQAACAKALKHIKSIKSTPDWLKLDLVVSEQILTIEELNELAQKTKRFHFGYGISFDSMYNFAFLEQEVNAAALIKYTENEEYYPFENKKIDELVGEDWADVSLREKCQLSIGNIVLHLRQTRNQIIDAKILKIQNVIIFKTVSVFSGEEIKGEDIASVNAEYLARNVQDDGKFVYGYYSNFNRKIPGYNMNHHALGVYALATAGSHNEQLKKALNFLLTDTTKNPAAILAILKCAEIFDGNYDNALSSFANRILNVQNGEAVYALLKLYQFDGNEKWLNSAKKSLEFFVANDYWKSNNPWITHCAAELEEYYMFGLRNAFYRLEQIESLELLCVTYNMMKGKEPIEGFDIERLKEAIEIRVQKQMKSLFTPETAMYFRSPETILGSVFVREQYFRVRIDDVAKNILAFNAYPF